LDYIVKNPEDIYLGDDLKFQTLNDLYNNLISSIRKTVIYPMKKYIDKKEFNGHTYTEEITEECRMCTAVCMRKKDSYFGRTLDVAFTYNEQITVMPRNFSLEFRHSMPLKSHYAMIGTAYVAGRYPLYYDATNECGLSMAGLKYGEQTTYCEQKPGFENVASFELIPKILGNCKNLNDARALLKNINVTNESYSDELKATPLHWIISDKEASIVLEPAKNGIRIYDNPAEILTNAPEFGVHLGNYERYVVSETPANIVRMIPGDSSSESRFIRTAYNLRNSVCQDSENECVGLFFHILDGVKKIKGCGTGRNQKYDITAYSSCCNINKGIYYYRTYTNSRICAVDMMSENLDNITLSSYPMIDVQLIYRQN